MSWRHAGITRTPRKFSVAKTPKHTSTSTTVQEFARDNILSKLPNCAKLFHGIVRNNSASTLFSRTNVIKLRTERGLYKSLQGFFLRMSRDENFGQKDDDADERKTSR